MPAMVSGFNCSHALPFNIDDRTRGGRQALRLLGAASRVVASSPASRRITFLELRSIGLPDAKRGSLCMELTDLIAEFCGIARDRIFLVMVDVDAKLWGYGGKTFG
jgi:phenylpyruvate tautomerase PptA (4-oxalocrotonate tautomerase family)